MRGEAYAHVIGELTEVRPNINANGKRELRLYVRTNQFEHFQIWSHSEGQHKYIEAHLKPGYIVSCRCHLSSHKNNVLVLKLLRLLVISRPGQPDLKQPATPSAAQIDLQIGLGG